MKKEIFAAVAALMIGTSASAQTITVYGNNDIVLKTFQKEKVKRIVFDPNDEVVEPTNGEAIDLGLSVEWASYNVGANSPEEYGGRYAWGETYEKEIYSSDTYFERGKLINTDIAGTEYDVAHVKWGGSWRMPRWEEIEELLNKCTWQWTTVNGVGGMKVIGPNGNSIFLPGAGKDGNGYYWSSTPHAYMSETAISLLFYPSGEKKWYANYMRSNGFSVRPVLD